MTLTISRATPRDVPALHDMLQKLCAHHGDTCQIGLADTEQALIHRPNLAAFIAHLDGNGVGYAVAETLWQPMNSGDAIDICHLYIRERHRNRGIGTALVNAVRDFALEQRACKLTIGTHPDNAGAAAAYRAMDLTELTGPNGARFSIPL